MTTKRCRPFGDELRDLLIERGITDGTGNANWVQFARTTGVAGYETLRKAVTRERLPSPDLMKRCAIALRTDPEIFSEYRLHLVRISYDPKEVGIAAALQALQAFESDSSPESLSANSQPSG
jgi:hypothetical protein